MTVRPVADSVFACVEAWGDGNVLTRGTPYGTSVASERAGEAGCGVRTLRRAEVLPLRCDAPVGVRGVVVAVASPGSRVEDSVGRRAGEPCQTSPQAGGRRAVARGASVPSPRGAGCGGGGRGGPLGSAPVDGGGPLPLCLWRSAPAAAPQLFWATQEVASTRTSPHLQRLPAPPHNSPTIFSFPGFHQLHRASRSHTSCGSFPIDAGSQPRGFLLSSLQRQTLDRPPGLTW